MFWVTVNDVHETAAPDEIEVELMIKSPPPPEALTVRSHTTAEPEVVTRANVAMPLFIAFEPVIVFALSVLLLLASAPAGNAVAEKVKVANAVLPANAVSGVTG